MTDRPDDPENPEIPLEPFPTTIPASPFPPLEGEAGPYPEEAAPTDPASDWIEDADAHDLSTAPAAVHPILALGRFAFPPGEPPDEEGVAARDRRWTSRVIVVATVFLLVFNAVSIQNWSRQQEPGWMTTTVRRLSDVWVEQIAQLGADRPRQTVRDGYQAAQEAGPPGQSEAAREGQ